VHLVGVYNGVAKHFWVGNDHSVVWSTLSVTGGEQPQVMVYDGQVMVAMKVLTADGQAIRIYTSADKGYHWTQIPDRVPARDPSIYHLYAFADAQGIHLTWDDNPNVDGLNQFHNEVYYLRRTWLGNWLNFKNVTDLLSPAQGGRPKVSVIGNKACVTFLGPTDSNWKLFSRDVNLDTGSWDSFYRSDGGGFYPVFQSAASIGDYFYTLGVSDIIPGSSQAQIFSVRHKDASSWTSAFGDGTSGGSLYQRNSLITNASQLYQVNYIPLTGVVAKSYDPSIGAWGVQEVVESYTSDQIEASTFLSGGQYGNYYFFNGWSPSFHQHMRRKAFVPTVAINAPVVSGWNMTGIPDAAYNLFKSQVYPTAITDAFRYEGGYVVTDPLANNRGWWIKFGAAENLSYSGARIDSMRMVVKNGWNIIGSISGFVPTSTITSDPPGIITSLFFKYASGGYVPTTLLEPGGGYWMSVNQDGRVILRAASGLLREGDDLASYDKFTVTDNVGYTQQVYVRNAVIVGTNESVGMPPPPPDADFDVRFRSGDIIRTVDPIDGVVDLAIEVNEATYPLTVAWDLNPENGITYSFQSGGMGKQGADSRISGAGAFTLEHAGSRLIQIGGRAEGQVPKDFALLQNYPNPFNPSTELRFDLPEPATVSLVVYDMLGRRVAELANGNYEAGYHTATWNASDMASGVYLARFTVVDDLGNAIYTKTNKLVLMK
jgi:hypothetical protein